MGKYYTACMNATNIVISSASSQCRTNLTFTPTLSYFQHSIDMGKCVDKYNGTLFPHFCERQCHIYFGHLLFSFPLMTSCQNIPIYSILIMSKLFEICYCYFNIIGF